MKKQLINKLIVVLSIVSLAVPIICFAENINIQADRQNFDGKTTVFEGNVRVDYADITVKSPKATVKSDNSGKPEAATFYNGAHAVRTNGLTKNEVKANILSLSLLKNKIKAEGNAESFVFENKKPIVHIKAASQEFDVDKNIIIATDDVKILYQDIKTNSKKAKISIDNNGALKKVELVGTVRVDREKTSLTAADVLYNPVTNEMVASGNTTSNTTLDSGEVVKIQADFQQYDNPTKTLITSGHVKINYKDYVAVGPKATFLPEKNSSKPNRIIFIGRAKIQEGERHVEADRIEITLNPKNFKAEGNVRTRFTQVQNYKEMKK